jgi:rod shape-determining protein MreD
MKKILILIIFFYILSLIQTGFLASFEASENFPNLILISLILLILLEKPRENSGYFAAFLGGFFIDVFSTNPFGMTIIFLLFLTFLLKKIISSLKKITAPWFLVLSLGFLIFYNLFSELILYSRQLKPDILLPGKLTSTFLLLLIVFYILRFSKRYVPFFASRAIQK